MLVITLIYLFSTLKISFCLNKIPQLGCRFKSKLCRSKYFPSWRLKAYYSYKYVVRYHYYVLYKYSLGNNYHPKLTYHFCPVTIRQLYKYDSLMDILREYWRIVNFANNAISFLKISKPLQNKYLGHLNFFFFFFCGENFSSVILGGAWDWILSQSSGINTGRWRLENSMTYQGSNPSRPHARHPTLYTISPASKFLILTLISVLFILRVGWCS